MLPKKNSSQLIKYQIQNIYLITMYEEQVFGPLTRVLKINGALSNKRKIGVNFHLMKIVNQTIG